MRAYAYNYIYLMIARMLIYAPYIQNTKSPTLAKQLADLHSGAHVCTSSLK